jgi:hypothetical protein
MALWIDLRYNQAKGLICRIKDEKIIYTGYGKAIIGGEAYEYKGTSFNLF